MTPHPEEERRAEIAPVTTWAIMAAEIADNPDAFSRDAMCGLIAKLAAENARQYAELTAALTAREGYVLVPVEPTKKMHKAAWDACENDMKPGADWPAFNAKLYRAMIAARPTPASGEGK